MSGRSFYTFNNINEYFGRSLSVVSPYQKGTIAFWGKTQVGQLNHRALVLGGDNRFYFLIGIDGSLNVVKTGADGFNVRTTTVLTDDGIWHHHVIAIDTTLADQTERCRLYLDGTECNYSSGTDYPIQNTAALDRNDWYINSPFYAPWLGYLDKFYFIDNAQLTPASFISGTPGGPIPFIGNYGTNGFFLDFDDASSPTAMGYDTSGHNLNFTPHNITVANNSSTDVPGIGLATGGLAVAAPVIDIAVFNSGAIAANLVAGSPQLSSATIGSAAPNSLTISSPVLGKPGIVMHGKNVLPDAVSLDGTQAPVLGSPNILSFISVTLENHWSVTDNVFIGGPFIDAKPSYDAVALIEKGGGTTGPYELYRSITREAKVDVYRLMFDVAPTGSGKYVEIGLTDDSVGGVSATFDPDTGECLARNSLVVGSATVQSDWKLIGVEADPLLNNYYRLQIVAQVRAVASIRAYIRLIDENLDADYSGDGIGSIFISDPRLLWSWDKRQFRWEIGPPEMRFYWTAHLSSLGLRWFRCGQGELGVDHHLEFINAPDLECVYRRWQPAQDELVFDYSGYLVAGTGNPMEGTP